MASYANTAINYIYSFFTSDSPAISSITPDEISNIEILKTPEVPVTTTQNYSRPHSFKHPLHEPIMDFIAKDDAQGLIAHIISVDNFPSLGGLMVNSNSDSTALELLTKAYDLIKNNDASDDFYNSIDALCEDTGMYAITTHYKFFFNTLRSDVRDTLSPIEQNILDKAQPLLTKEEYLNGEYTNAEGLDFFDIANFYDRYDILDLFSIDEKAALRFDKNYADELKDTKEILDESDAQKLIKFFTSADGYQVFDELVCISIQANHSEFLTEICDFITTNNAWGGLYASMTRFAQSFGASKVEINTIFAIYKFATQLLNKDFNLSENLSAAEQNILDKTQPLLTKEEYVNGEYTNAEGLDFFNLAIMYSRKDILSLFDADEIKKMIFKSLDTGISSFYLMDSMFTFIDCFDMAVYEKILTSDIVDFEISEGQSHLDLLVNCYPLKEFAINNTTDSFYALLKHPECLEDLLGDSSKTYIAISSDDGVWSDSLLHAARNIMKETPHIQFLLVSNEVIEKTNGAIFQKVDGWMNPGSFDSYTNSKEEFDNEAWAKNASVEQLYANVLDAAKAHNFPILGVCGGAQSAVLHNGGSVQKIEGYNGSAEKHEIIFQSGTLGHLLSLTKSELVTAFDNGILPEVKYLGETYHGYAAVSGKLGTNLNIDAISEDGVPMAYSGSDDIVSFNTQYHPEMYYMNSDASEEGDVNHQKALLDNFVKLAEINHMHKAGEAHHPQEYLNALKDYISGDDIGIEKVELIQDYFTKLDLIEAA